MAHFRIPYGFEKSLELEIKDREVALNVDKEFPREPADLEEAVVEALEHPVDGEPFSSRLKKAENVLIVVDNWARLTPAYRILPPLIKQIKDKGKAVEILVANGLLREMTETELQNKLGAEVLGSRIPIYQNKASQSLSLIHI